MSGNRKRIYTTWERTWHWVQSMAMVALLATGFHIHSPVRAPIADLATVVWLHNVSGFILIGNALLGLFYYATTGAIRHYLPSRNGLVGDVVAQVSFYTRGIFRGEAHPSPKTPERRLNPLQQLTYLALLNVLLPLQVGSGLLMWGASRWPQAAGAVGGLPVLGAVHTLGSYLFLSFLIAHLYLITTGHTPLSCLEGMATGFEELEETAGAGPVPRASR
ncbi:MAG: cytochrome b/b6 domain-containing protein [Thermoguttaceae bacterium]